MSREGSFAFSSRVDGDLRLDLTARRRWAASLGAPAEWGTARQVHGNSVRRVRAAGEAGEADALFTTEPGLGLAVFTADCAGVAVIGDHGVGVAHAGWRGAHAGVVAGLVAAMRGEGLTLVGAHIGPAIGPCCFEVGEEVARLFPDSLSVTTWGGISVDLVGSVRRQLASIEVDALETCTFHEGGWWSHRREGSTERMATLVWLRD